MHLLKRLTETPGVSGREERIRDVIRREVEGLFDEVRTDDLGNLICFKKAGKRARGRKPRSVMIPCHMDEIGFYVKHVDENGFLKLQAVGGFDVRNLFARRVVVHGKRDLMGHIQAAPRPRPENRAEELGRDYAVGDLWVDMMRDGPEVRRLVQVGDPVTLHQPMMAVNDHYVGKAMDDRAGNWVAIDAVRRVGSTSPYDIYYVATTQEEVGCRGAGPSAFGIDPDVAIVLDVTVANDRSGEDAKAEQVITLEGGPALCVVDGGAISDRQLLDEFIALARRKRIAYQVELFDAGATDAATVQRAGAGRPTVTLSIPTRNLHTVVETVHRKDLEATAKLVAAWLGGRAKG